jgi:hypothetical protein
MSKVRSIQGVDIHMGVIDYPDLLKKTSFIIDNPIQFPNFKKPDGSKFDLSNIIIFPIYMIGHFRIGIGSLLAFRVKPQENSSHIHKMIFTGDPCVYSNIDCMQLIMKRSLWLKYGGWYDKRPISDGIMYERFVNDHGARYLDSVQGEHW